MSDDQSLPQRASLTHLGSLESVTVDWNPESYSVSRSSRLAAAGGICISATVYDSIVNKLGLEYEYLGDGGILLGNPQGTTRIPKGVLWCEVDDKHQKIRMIETIDYCIPAR